ncbi:hypothetical protein Hanom_Chr10g00873601 [Helianthus anomalus]
MNRQLLNSLPMNWDADVAMIKRMKNLNDVTLTELIDTIKSCVIDNQQRELNQKSSLMAARLTSSKNALISQYHPNILFSPVHGVSNANPNIVFSPLTQTPKTNYVYGMSLPTPQVIVNSPAPSSPAQPQTQYPNVVYCPVTPSPFQGATSSATNQNTAFLTKQNEERLTLVASMLYSLHAFLAGDLLLSTHLANNINQVV